MEHESTGSRYKKGLPRELNINPYPPFLYGIVLIVVAVLAALILSVLAGIVVKKLVYDVVYYNATPSYMVSTIAHWLVLVVPFFILLRVYKIVRNRLHKVIEDKAKAAASQLLSNVPKSLDELDYDAAKQLLSCAMSSVCFYYDDPELFDKKNNLDMCIGTLFGLFAVSARFALKYGRETVEKYVLDARAVIEGKCGEEGARLFTLLCTDLYNGYAADAAITEAGAPVDALMAIAKRFETDPIIHDTDGSYQLIAFFLNMFAENEGVVTSRVSDESNRNHKQEINIKKSDKRRRIKIVHLAGIGIVCVLALFTAAPMYATLTDNFNATQRKNEHWDERISTWRSEYIDSLENPSLDYTETNFRRLYDRGINSLCTYNKSNKILAVCIVSAVYAVIIAVLMVSMVIRLRSVDKKETSMSSLHTVKNVRYVMPDGTVKEKSLTPEMISMLEQLPEITDHTGEEI